MVVIAPANMPIIPIIMSRISLTSFIRNGPKLRGKLTQISMNAGKIIPNADRHKAPNRDMNRPRAGIDIARATVNKKKIFSCKTCCFSLNHNTNTYNQPLRREMFTVIVHTSVRRAVVAQWENGYFAIERLKVRIKIYIFRSFW